MVEGCSFPMDQSFHVLLVEDDECTLKLVEKLLRKCHYEVTLARNGREAMEILESEDGALIDVILTDLLMPEVSGMDLICEVVQGDRLRDVPVIVMSSESRQETVLKAFEAGASDYLIKPIRRNELTTLWQHVWRINRTKAPSENNSGSLTQAMDVDGSPTHDPASTSSSRQAGLPAGPTTSAPGGMHMPAGTYSSSPGGSTQTQLRQPAAQSAFPQPIPIPSRPQQQQAAQSQSQSSSLPSAFASLNTQPHGGLVPSTQPLGSLNSGLSSGPASVELTIKPLDVAPLQTSAPANSMDWSALQASLQQHTRKDATPLPQGLQELAALGSQLDLQRSHSPTETDEDMQAATLLSLRHHTTSSAFQCFTAVVPRPCARGDTAAVDRLGSGALSGTLLDRLGASSRTPSLGTAGASGSAASIAAKPQRSVDLGDALRAEAALPHAVRAAAHPTRKSWDGQHHRQVGEMPLQHQQFFKAFQEAVDRHSGILGSDALGVDTAANRRAAIIKFREKRKARNFDKKVRYESRRRLAEARPRVRGQFVKAEVLAAFQAQQAGKEAPVQA